MRKIVALLAFVMTITGSYCFADIKLSKYAKVYKGDEGILVTMVPLSPKGEKKALIEVSGIDTELDGLILLYDFTIQGRSEAYVMTYDGRGSTRLRTNKGYWSKGTNLYLPDVKGEMNVYYDEKLTNKIDIEKFKARYIAQETKKVQEKLAVFKREKHVKQNTKAFNEKAAKASKACGTKIQAEIDWKSIPDKHLKKISISGYCGNPLDKLAYLCKKSEANKKTLSGKVNKIKCRMGEKVHLSIKNKVLTWTTVKETPNQGDFAKYVLMNEL